MGDVPLQRVHSGLKVETLFVLVGGVGTTPPEDWTTRNGALWLSTINKKNAPNVGIASFPHRLAPNGNITSRNVDEQGSALLRALENFIAEDSENCPIAIVAHSLGGLIVKKVYNLAKQGAPHYRNVLRRLACFVLLGCPHSNSQEVQEWRKVEDILHKFSGKGKKQSSIADCTSQLAEDCDKFQFFVGDDHVPILSAYETKGMQRHPLGKKVKFSDEGAVTVGTAEEVLVELDSNHKDLCLTPQNKETVVRIFDFLDDALGKAREVIAKGSPQYTRPVDTASTVAAESVAGDLMEESRSEGGDLGLQNQPQEVNLSFIDSDLPSLTPKQSGTREATAGSSEGDANLIAALTDFSLERKDPKLPYKRIPYAKDDVFSGREDMLASVRRALMPGDQVNEAGNHASLNVFTLCGPGGMGKTSIANEFVHRVEKDFEVILWITADSESKLNEDLSIVAAELGLLSTADTQDIARVREALLTWLANPLKSYQHLNEVKPELASWLIVFDNTENSDIFDTFWPRDSSGSILVTCRNPLVMKYIHLRDFGENLFELPDDEGIRLLLNLTGRQNEQEDVKTASAVVEMLSGYPLAIAQMSGVINTRDLSFRDFLEFYEKESDRKEMIGDRKGQHAALRQYNQTLATVWALEKLKEGRAVLDVVSLLDPDSIEEAILDSNPACSDWTAYPKTTFKYTNARSELQHGSLISRNRDVKTLRVHRLIQDTVRAQMDDATYNEVYRRTLDMMAEKWPTTFSGFGNVQTDWDKCDALWKHIIALLKHGERFDPTVSVCDTAIRRAEFILDAAWYSVMSSHFAQSNSLFAFSRKLRDAIKIESTADRAQLLSWERRLQKLDITYHHHQGELGLHTNNGPGSVANFGLCVQQLRTFLTDEEKQVDSFFGVALNELGCAYMQTWSEEEALRAFEESLEVLQNLKEPTKQLSTMPQINLGFAYGSAGRYDEASEMFEAALKDRFEELTRDDVSSFVNGKLYLGWGNVLAARGQLDESFKLHAKCLEHYKLSVGKFHHRTGDGCVKLSDHFARVGDNPSALALLDQAIKIFEEHGYHKPEAARAYFKRMKVLQAEEKLDDAAEAGRRALEMYNQIVPMNERTADVEGLDHADFDQQIMFWSR